MSIDFTVISKTWMLPLFGKISFVLQFSMTGHNPKTDFQTFDYFQSNRRYPDVSTQCTYTIRAQQNNERLAIITDVRELDGAEMGRKGGGHASETDDLEKYNSLHVWLGD